MLKLVSGTTFFISISLTRPKPLHLGQAPSGELNEKILGAGSPYESPETGSMRRLEKFRVSSLSLSITMITPSPCFIAVATVRRRRSSSPGSTLSLSITTSMLWFLYRSTFMTFALSYERCKYKNAAVIVMIKN